MIFAIISDISDHSHRWAVPLSRSKTEINRCRTQLLYLLAAGPHINRLIAPRISAVIMSRSLYAPFLVAITVDSFCLVLINFIPFSIPSTRSCFALVEDQDSTSFQDPDDLSPTTAHAEMALIAQSPVPSPANKTTVKSAWSRALESISNASVLFEHPASKFCSIAYFLKRIAFASEAFMFQYASEKFLWALYQTTWLRVAQACGAVAVTLIVYPLLTLYLSRRGVASPHHWSEPDSIIAADLDALILLCLEVAFSNLVRRLYDVLSPYLEDFSLIL